MAIPPARLCHQLGPRSPASARSGAFRWNHHGHFRFAYRVLRLAPLWVGAGRGGSGEQLLRGPSLKRRKTLAPFAGLFLSTLDRVAKDFRHWPDAARDGLGAYLNRNLPGLPVRPGSRTARSMRATAQSPRSVLSRRGGHHISAGLGLAVLLALLIRRIRSTRARPGAWNVLRPHQITLA